MTAEVLTILECKAVLDSIRSSSLELRKLLLTSACLVPLLGISTLTTIGFLNINYN